MPRHKVLEIVTEGVPEHRAVQAWLQVQPDSCAPRSLDRAKFADQSDGFTVARQVLTSRPPDMC